VFGNKSRIDRDVERLEPGSYLLVARAPGHADQRLPFVAPPDGRVEIKERLWRKEDVPPGFVWIPEGKFQFGGDPEARRSSPRTVDLGGFFIGRYLVTMRQWEAFMNAPETERTRRQGDDPLFALPRLREVNRSEVKLFEFEEWDPGAPVCGVSLSEVHAFIAFLNAGDPRFRYALPTEEQWEKAARGADGRWFTWGNRFDGGLSVCSEREGGEDLLGFAAGYEPADESPYGVRDMNGTRREWTSTADRKAPGHYVMRGHAHLDSEGAPVYRLCDRKSQPGFDAHMYFGFRLVAYPRRRE
jgi:serine/threonine-protein kinase